MTAGGRADGFTLLEVLVALAVLAVAGAALVETQRQSSLAVRRGEGRARALSAAASLLAEAAAGARPDGSGSWAPGVRYRLASRARPDLVRAGAPVQAIEREALVTVAPMGAARLATIDWRTSDRR